MLNALVRRLLRAPETARRFADAADGLPPAAPVSIELPLDLPAGNALDLLPPRLPYWYHARPEQGDYRLGIGHAFQVASAGPHRFQAIDHALSGLHRSWAGGAHALAFCGFAFDERQHDAPQPNTLAKTLPNTPPNPLPNALLAIPALLLECRAEKARLVLTAPAARWAPTRDELLAGLEPTRQPDWPEFHPDRPTPLADRAWTARTSAAIRDIEAGHLAKLVLARSRGRQARSSIPVRPLLACLIAQQPDCVVFAHGQGERAFLGATPECLVSLHAGHACADALAGTAWPGSLALDDGKNRHEQSLVVDAVRTTLAAFGDTAPTVETASEHPAGHLRHLRSRVRQSVRPGTRLLELVGALHPTPAVGGWPTAAAMHWLANHNERRPGWYSGGFGLLDAEGNGEFSVALRSALIEGPQLELQAGAGIVAASDPQLELAETEAKFGTLLAALATLDAEAARQRNSPRQA